nr:PAS domain S-box protein [uncultured Draconibacterium sp.]
MKDQTDQKIAHLHKIIDTSRQIQRLITSERQADVILDKTCKILVETREYYFAWIALFDEEQNINFYTCEGNTTLGNDIKQQLFAKEQASEFWQNITNDSQTVLKKLSPHYIKNIDTKHWIPFLSTIQENGQALGVMCVAVPAKDAKHPKEELCIVDMSNNIAFALSKIRQYDKLKSNELHYKNLVNTLNDGLLILQDGVMKFVNQSLCKLTGYSEAELLNKDFTMLVAPEELDRVRMLYTNILSGKEDNKNYDSVAVTKHGQTFSVEITAVTTDFNNQPAFLVILHDNSELKKSLARLKEREEHFHFLSDASFEGIIIHDNGVVLDVNQRLLDISGYSREDLLGKNMLSGFIIEPDRQKAIESIQSETPKPYVIGVRKKDGIIGYAEIEARSIPYKGKTVRIAAVRDVSERFQLQEEIKRNKERLNRLLDNLPGVAYNCQNDEYWSMNFVSEGSFQLFGYQPEELIGGNKIKYNDLIHPDDKANIRDTIQKAIDNKETFEVEYRILTRQGDIKWVWERGKPVYNLEDVVLEGFITDITQRKMLERWNEMLSKAIESSSASILITDANGKLEYVNPYFEEKTGYKREEVIGKNPKILSSGKHDILFYKQLWDTIRSGKIWQGEFKNKKKNGKSYWEQASISPIFDKNGKIIQFVAVKEDITEKRKTLKALKKAKLIAEQNEKRFKALHNASFGGIAIHDKGQILDCNEGLSRITGYTYEELMGMDGLLLIAEENRELVLNHIYNEYDKPYETFGLRKNGQKYPLRIEARMIPYNNKRVRVVEFRDISEQKRIEQELILAKEKAEQTDKLKSSFLANMSHEIRTPMNGILGFTELLKEPDLSLQQRSDFIDTIQTSGERMLSTINDIIDISKIESGMVMLNMQDINLIAFINDLYNFFQPMMLKKDIDFKVNSNNGHPISLFHTDPDKLHSILTNLIKNAYKFTASGTIEFGYTVAGNTINFYVTDTGVGIQKDRQKAIFERFVQADIADSRVFEGSGLGLAITKSYTEMLNGSISLESKFGKGSTFKVCLPIPHSENAENTNAEKDEYKIEDRLNHSLKIMVAEDDPVSVELLKLLVNDVASEILVARNGKDAVDIVAKTPDIDLVLMDIKMPVIDGYTATKKIREFNKSVKIIAQSAFAQPDDIRKATAAGCNHFVSKPINKRNLFEAIKELFKTD